ncbi:ABC transporter ATP-binding protein [Peredibacter starrii]|uniref:ABC transporter ATP-binding protein n=1 Tax=Peredibacter starrii TaxID=28202 RepID=A0AAX4HNW0_9BACT|nr:ABC transporter ATP-binding protein [Peredibacter starrii]WPU64803.1 ABC transporter ATP-binding protein [Peredibacter starrii]
MNIIEVKNLSMAFGANKVLEDISFNIKKGSFTALLGQNGSGKSTILNLLMGQLKLSKGECELFGQDIKKDPYELKNKIGLVTEKIRFDYPETIHKFMAEYAKLFNHFDLEYFYKLAQDVKLDLSKQFGSYSRGQKMQIVLMSALAQKPELLLIDEVTAVLDAYTRNYFITLLRQFTSQGGTVIITTNIVTEVQFYCSDVIFLNNKKIKFQTELAQIKSDFKKIRIKDGTHPVLQKKDCIWAGINSDGSQTYLVSKETFKSLDLNGIHEDKRSITLEDLYIYHSQSEEL